MNRRAQQGFTLVELIVSLAVLLVCVTGLAKMMVRSSQINKAQQMTVRAQSTARNALSMLEQKLRGAGWDPRNSNIGLVTLDPNLADDISEITIFSDLNGDGNTNGMDEEVLIRHSGSTIVWRRSSSGSQPFEVLASEVTNDADGNGTPEPMFVPDSLTDPTRITIRITAQSPVPSPVTGEFVRYTATSDVILRSNQ